MSQPQLFKKVKRLFWLLKHFKIPLIGYANPKIIHLDEKEIRVKIKLRRRTKNHLNSMYFGALAIGADVVAGVHAFYFGDKYNKKVSFAFKGMECEFIKRAETDVIFVMNQGELIEKAIQESSKTGERINQPVEVTVFNVDQEVVATFKMISSVKCK